MDQEQSWISITEVGEDTHAANETYRFFMRPEPREGLGPIEVERDEFLGRGIKVREMLVGMTRNAKEENKKPMKVYLEPFPHVRIDKAKPLQGWYKNLHEPPGVRPRPCFTEAVLTEPYGGYCAVGCAFAVCSGQTIDSPSGPILVNELQTGDVVWGRTDRGIEPCDVGTVVKRFTRKALEVILSDGVRLRVTPDHPVYVPGKGWIRSDQVQSGDLMERLDEMLYLQQRVGEEKDLLRQMLQRESASRILQATPSAKEGVSEVRGMREAHSSPEARDLFRQMSLRSNSETNERQYQRAYGSPEVLSLRESDSSIPESLRRLLVGNSIREREEDPRKYLRREAQIQRDSGEDAKARSYAGYGGARKVPRQEIPLPRDCYEVQLGGPGSQVSLLTENPLELRAYGNPSQERREVHSRLLTSRFGRVLGGQGLYLPQSILETSESQTTRLHYPSLERSEAKTARVVEVKEVDCGWVYDFETSSENYYVNGVLVHNCYVNSGFRGYRGTGLITVPLNYGEQIKKQLSKTRRAAAGYFSSFTDPFLPLEDWYHNTRDAAREFVNVGLPIFFLSRLRYPTWAINLMRKNPHSYAQKSINTASPRDWQLLSPGALSLEDHLKDIRRLKDNGIYISIQVNPVIPGVTNHSGVEKTFKMLADAGADHVIVKFVEAGYSWAPAMVERIRKRFGKARGDRFEELFTENIGGQRTIREDYRMEGHKRYSKAAARYGLTYSVCYEYRYERDEQGNIFGKTGVSIGREFTTSPQCHGHAVPMYTRDSEYEPFRPVEECPPSGCLYCASENEGEPRCGDPLAGEANAMRASDFRVPIGEGAARNENSPLVQLGDLE